MPFTDTRIPATAFPAIVSGAIRIRDRAANASAVMAAGAVRASDITSILVEFRDAGARLKGLRDTPGLGAYAKAQKDDAAFDALAKIDGITAAIDAVLAAILADFPKAPTGELLERTLNADFSFTENSFPPARTVALRTVLDAVVAAI